MFGVLVSRACSHYNSTDWGSSLVVCEHWLLRTRHTQVAEVASSGLTPAQGLIDMHVVVESLRNSFALLYSQVHQFMRTVVFDSGETNVAAWHIAGVDADVRCICEPIFQQSTPCQL